jgi:hypothetical protein
LFDAFTAVQPRISSKLTANHLSVRFHHGSLDSGKHTRLRVLNYSIKGDVLRRVDPIAETPADFVEEWLAEPWSAISQWSAPSTRSAHQQLHRDYVHGEFLNLEPCRAGSALWQIGIDIQGLKDTGKRYFLVRELGPQRYRMERVSTASVPACAEN